MIYKWAMLIGMLLGMCACQWKNITGSDRMYKIQGIQTYRGQDVSQLFNYNGAPNSVKRLKNGKVMWIYYTNYRPVGEGEIISFNEPTASQIATSCVVKVIIYNNVVENVISNCN